jgi:hypothetical protein
LAAASARVAERALLGSQSQVSGESHYAEEEAEWFGGVAALLEKLLVCQLYDLGATQDRIAR